MTPEGRVKHECKAFLRTFGPQVYAFWPVQTGFGNRTVDCLMCVRGHFLAIECKAPGIDEPSKFQGVVMKTVDTAGGITLLVNDVQQLKDLFAMCFPGLKPVYP